MFAVSDVSMKIILLSDEFWCMPILPVMCEYYSTPHGHVHPRHRNGSHTFKLPYKHAAMDDVMPVFDTYQFRYSSQAIRSRRVAAVAASYRSTCADRAATGIMHLWPTMRDCLATAG